MVYAAPKNIYRERVDFALAPAGRTSARPSRNSLPARRNSMMRPPEDAKMSAATAANC
jgi:hypothetical protein